MKKLLLSLMVLAALASCGKDNNVSTGASGVYTDPLSNPHLSGNYASHKALTDAKMAIDNYQTYFGTGAMYGGSGANNSNCKSKLSGWVTICTSSNSGYNTGSYFTVNQYIAHYPNAAYIYSDGNYVVHSSVNIAAKQSELANIFANATQINYVDYADGRIFYVRVNNDQYEINTKYPIQGNPAKVNGRYLYNIQ